MSRHGAIELDWADGTYTFRLSVEGIEELEAKWSTEAGRDVSLFAVSRLLSPEVRNARVFRVSEVLRVGLIGGGTPPVEALGLVRRYVDERPNEENRDVAYAVILAGLARVHSKELETPSGEAEAAETNGSTSPPSTQTQL